MASRSTLALVRKAREGDPAARSQLIQRYYQDWLDRVHGDLGKTIRKLYDTVDVVQSAVADALEALPTLKNEGVFFTWVTSIIRHKIASRKRRLAREVALDGLTGPRPDGAIPATQSSETDGDTNIVYLETLDGILALFPEHPEEMTAVVLKLLDERPVRFIQEFLGLPERTVFRRIKDGMDLLRRRLGT